MPRLIPRQRSLLGTLAIVCSLVGLSLLVALTSTFSTISTILAQEGAERPALQKAVQALGAYLGVSITVVDAYTFQGQSFADSALGCPVAGQTYVAGPIQGYQFTVTYRKANYDIRTNADGSLVVLCGVPPITPTAVPASTEQAATPASPAVVNPVTTSNAPSAPINIPLTIFRAPQFSLAYPETWNATTRSDGVYFGPNTGPACSDPGMFATFLGEGLTLTADAVIDAYATEARATLETTRRDIRTIGRSALAQTRCSDGSIRTIRITGFISGGRGIRITQFANEAQFAVWDPLYLQILDRFSPASSAVNSNGDPVQRPSTSPLAWIVHQFAGNIYTGTLIDLPGLAATNGGSPGQPAQQASISPTGAQVAVIDARNQLLLIRVGAPSSAVVVMQNALSAYPPAWSPDGAEVAALVKQGDAVALLAARFDGQPPRKIADVTLTRVECPLTTDISELFYQRETGISGNIPLLKWLPSGSLVFSLSCEGIGLARVNAAGGTPLTINPNVRRVMITPDARNYWALLPIENGETALISGELGNEAFKPVIAKVQLDQFALSADSRTLYYSELAQKSTTTLDDAAEQERIQASFGVFPLRYTTYTVTLHQLDLGTGQYRVLYTGEGRGIGRILPSPDGSGVLFSLIPTLESMVEAFKANVLAAELRRQVPATRLYWLPNEASIPQLVAITAQASWSVLGAAPAPTPTGGFTAVPTRRILGPTVGPTATPQPLLASSTAPVQGATRVPALATNTPNP